MADKKKGKKKVRVVTKHGAPMFKYLCVCHNEVATKGRCEMEAGARVGDSIVVYRDGEKHGHAPKGESTLGSWRCGKTNKKTKVTRVQNAKDQTPAQEVTLEQAQ